MLRKAFDIAGAILCLGVCSAGVAQDANPFEGDADAIRAGEAYFASRCTDCHGADAKGLTGPDLTAIWLAGKTDIAAFQTIRNGVENSIMVPSAAPDEQIWAVITYLKSISTVPPFEVENGDARRGQDLFAAECASCHSVDGGGGRLGHLRWDPGQGGPAPGRGRGAFRRRLGTGPDLSRIAEVRSMESLISAIRDPSAEIPPGFRGVTLITAGGEEVRGVVKSEDAFSIQIVGADERLQGYFKSWLKEVVREQESLMPLYGSDRLNEAQLRDLLAYLATLRRDTGTEE